MSCEWHRNDSITPSFPNTSSVTGCRWWDLTKMWHTVSIHQQCSHWGGCPNKICTKNIMTNIGAIEDNIFPPWQSIGELPISNDWLRRTKLGQECQVGSLNRGSASMVEGYRIVNCWPNQTDVIHNRYLSPPSLVSYITRRGQGRTGRLSVQCALVWLHRITILATL